MAWAVVPGKLLAVSNSDGKGMAEVSWPYREWNRALADDMRAAGISTWAQLGSLAGVNRSGFSRYSTGEAQPTVETAIKVAAALGVSPVPYLVYSGRIKESDIEAPLLPSVYRSLVALDRALPDDERERLRQHVEVLVSVTRKRAH